jgi:hypothetical protein
MRRAKSQAVGASVDQPNKWMLVSLIISEKQIRFGENRVPAKFGQLAERARAKKLAPAELEGATCTVSNLGAFGVDNGTPVIFAPQAALMFVGAIRDEVLAIDGRIEVRPAMQITVAYDHRGIDGATASRFTTKVKHLLEAAEIPGVSAAPPALTFAKREVAVEFSGDGLRTSVRHGSIAWINSAEPDEGLDPVTAFMGALASCLLMSLRVAARARNFDLDGAKWS